MQIIQNVLVHSQDANNQNKWLNDNKMYIFTKVSSYLFKNVIKSLWKSKWTFNLLSDLIVHNFINAHYCKFKKHFCNKNLHFWSAIYTDTYMDC